MTIELFQHMFLKPRTFQLVLSLVELLHEGHLTRKASWVLVQFWGHSSGRLKELAIGHRGSGKI